jgi:hypothetical protein
MSRILPRLFPVGTKIPLSKLMEGETEKLMHLEQYLHKTGGRAGGRH